MSTNRPRALVPQFHADGWAVARTTGLPVDRHAFRVLYRGESVGYLIHYADGWRWLLVGLATHRESPRIYSTWQAAAGALGRTAHVRRITRQQRPTAPADWRPANGKPWTPSAAAVPADDTTVAGARR